MQISELELPGVFEILLQPHEDDRGFFMRVYDSRVFKKWGLRREWVQENHSLSIEKGVLRGLHFQFPPHSETKLVRAIKGEIYDVFVDLRKGSKTFGKWGGANISAEKKNMVYIPRGFAHGYCTLTENCEVVYKVDNYYSPESEGIIIWNDPDVGIKWPISHPILSEKDRSAGSFKDFTAANGGGLIS